ncbi:MAG: hypothetical protein OEY91_02355 [Nitrospirota bacterium]|nr:hypothetical protein [Nitrospirota bacterium]
MDTQHDKLVSGIQRGCKENVTNGQTGKDRDDAGASVVMEREGGLKISHFFNKDFIYTTCFSTGWVGRELGKG